MEPERRAFLEKLFIFLEDRGTPVTSSPSVMKQPLDLYKLYLCVKEKGGMVELRETKKWKEICVCMNIRSSASTAFVLKKNYMKYLFAYECQFDKGGIDPRPILSQMEQALAHGRDKKQKRSSSPIFRLAKVRKHSRSGFVEDWQSGKSLAECNLHMLTSEDSCDVSFRVGKDKKIVRAHRFVLISRSCVFHTMLCGPLAEKGEITITDVDADIFSDLLRYLYTNELDPNPENVTGLLYLAKKYAVGGLEHLCLTYLKSSLSAENACVILEQAHVFDEKELYDTAMEIVLENGEKCLGSVGFKQLCRECFDKVISSDQLDVKAEQMFSAVLSWTEEESRRQEKEVTPVTQRSILGQTLYMIPFHEMDQKYFVKEVIPRKILTSDETVVIMSHHACPENDLSPFRQRRTRTTSGSEDVIFYNRHQKIRHYVGQQAYSRIEFIPSHDVAVLGVYVFGSEKISKQKYQKCFISVGQFNSTFSSDRLLDSECQSTAETKFEKRVCIRTIHFKEPLNIKGGFRHYINISLPGRPEYEGDGAIQSTTEGQCAFTNIENNYYTSRNLIYGLVTKQ